MFDSDFKQGKLFVIERREKNFRQATRDEWCTLFVWFRLVLSRWRSGITRLRLWHWCGWIISSIVVSAEDYLSFAFQRCHRSCVKNKRQILIYLLPVKMLLVGWLELVAVGFNHQAKGRPTVSDEFSDTRTVAWDLFSAMVPADNCIISGPDAKGFASPKVWPAAVWGGGQGCQAGTFPLYADCFKRVTSVWKTFFARHIFESSKHYDTISIHIKRLALLESDLQQEICTKERQFVILSGIQILESFKVRT